MIFNGVMAFVKITYCFKWVDFMVCKLYFNKAVKKWHIAWENSNNTEKCIKKKKLLKISPPSNYQLYHFGGCLLLLFSIITHTQKYVSSLMLCLGTHHSPLFETPWTVALQAPLSMGFSRQEYWSGLPCPPPGDLSNPRVKPRSPALQVDSLPSEPPGKTPDDAYAY